MDAFFAGLTKRQAMMLLTAVTFGGPEGVDALGLLASDEADLLQERARQILGIPREQRVPFLVQEMKRFVSARTASPLRTADAQGVAAALEGERPALIEVVLRGLPSALGAEVARTLGHRGVKRSREIRPEVLAAIRCLFEERLAETAPGGAAFALADILLLSTRDLACLADALGARALASAVAGLEAEDRDAFVQALPADQRQRLVRLMRRTPPPLLPPGKAREQVDAAARGAPPPEALRTAGLRALARACLAQSAELAARLVEKHPGDLGRALARILPAERRRPTPPERSTAVEVLRELERMADQGIIERPVHLPPPVARGATSGGASVHTGPGRSGSRRPGGG